MIELHSDSLNFHFPGVHEDARCSIDFQRTLRIPDDNKPYPLPAGLGRFPVKHIDDYAQSVPHDWVAHGGVFIPMYQSEALWINFNGSYPCAVKIAAGKINAVDGALWNQALSCEPQDYVVIPEQPWLDGFNVSEGFIRQFVAMPLGQGYTAEEQITGRGEHGGLQVVVYPMKRDHYEAWRTSRLEVPRFLSCESMCVREDDSFSMGLAPGGLMRQEIYDDPHGVEVWDQSNGLRCFIHLVNSAAYGEITGTQPPQKPPSATDYAHAGLPWFDYYADKIAVKGSPRLAGLASIGAKTLQTTGQPLADNQSVAPATTVTLGGPRPVRQGEF